MLAQLLALPAEQVAPQLLGGLIAANGVTIRLVEVEAYGGVGEDPASHAFRGQTRRNTPMFGPPGTLYVYFTYGMHWCANIVCQPEGVASAVLLRAGQVVAGLELAQSRARIGSRAHQLAQGPARLTRVLALNGAASGSSVLSGNGPVTLSFGEDVRPNRIRTGPRIGLTQGAEEPMRFWLDDSTSVSG